MNNPLRILRSLDSHLTRPTGIVLYGRSALALGFPDGSELGVTVDVDGILPEAEMTAIEADEQFWTAVDRTNRELEPAGLYITHLFTDSQVILRPDWMKRLAPIECGLRWLQVARPDVLDLILTKMMREDPQDLADIAFLLRHATAGIGELEAAFAAAKVPAIEEIQTAFSRNRERVLALARSLLS